MKRFDSDEGQTPLSHEEMQGLKKQFIKTHAELDMAEQENIFKARLWCDVQKSNEILNESFVRKLHLQMFSDVWSWAGAYRHSDKNLGVAHHQISTQLQNLLEDTKYWIEHEVYSADETAARFHHRLVSIHPFSNGNGRHARLMTDLLCEIVLGVEIFSWGIHTEDARQKYLHALREADERRYLALVEFVRS